MPLFTSSSIAAKVKIDPRIGPMHGVHPKPKAAPTMNGKAKLWLYVFVKNLTSLFINLKLIIPIRWREKKIIIKPAKILKLSEFDKKLKSPYKHSDLLARCFGIKKFVIYY